MDVSSSDLSNYKKSFEKKTKYKVLQGVLRKAPIIDVSINQNALTKLPFKFNNTLSTDVTATDQMDSGRCWIFAGLNIIRHKMISHHKLTPTFELSQAYIHRCDKLERCNAAIELIYELAKQGKNNDSIEYIGLIPGILGDGGTWDMFTNIVKKYGIVPKEVYPDTFQASHTARMNDMLKITVLKTSDVIKKTMNLSEFITYKKTIMEECFRIVNLCLGNIPEKFIWAFTEKKNEKEYTPKSYYDTVIKPLVDLKKFVSICNFPVEQYNQILAVEYLHNILEKNDDVKKKLTDVYLNVEMNVFKEAVFKSIKKEIGVWFACDIGQFWINRGTVLDQNASNLRDMFDVEFTLSKRAGLQTRTNLPNHAMLFTGCHKEEDEYKRWKVENSHGINTELGGFITMSDSWFSEYVICAAVPIDCLPIKLRKIALEKKYIKWLPFFSPLGTFAG